MECTIYNPFEYQTTPLKDVFKDCILCLTKLTLGSDLHIINK